MDKVNRVTFEAEADLYEKKALAEIKKAHCDPTEEMGEPFSILQMGRRVIYRAKQELANRVKVVRCFRCHHWDEDEEMEGGGYCNHPRFYVENTEPPIVQANDFCSYGERREGE